MIVVDNHLRLSYSADMQLASSRRNFRFAFRVGSCSINVRIFRLTLVVFLLMAGVENASSQVNNSNILGYKTCIFLTGSNLYNNPLVVGKSNGLNEIFSQLKPVLTPEGTTVSLWNPKTLAFDTTSTFTNGSWTTNFTLPPGRGALVFAPSTFTNVVNGFVLGHDGLPIVVGNGLAPPPLFAGANGVYLLGDKCPIADIGTNIFINILGRFPFVGEQVTTLLGTSTYLGSGQWNSVPVLGVGQAAFINIESEAAPVLTIQHNNNQAIVSWPFTVNQWTLQTNNSLTAGSWGNYAGAVINNTVTNSPLSENLFFRLAYP